MFAVSKVQRGGLLVQWSETSKQLQQLVNRFNRQSFSNESSKTSCSKRAIKNQYVFFLNCVIDYCPIQMIYWL